MVITDIHKIKKYLLYIELEITDLEIQKLEHEKVQDFLQARFTQEQINKRKPWIKDKLRQLENLFNDDAEHFSSENFDLLIEACKIFFQFSVYNEAVVNFMKKFAEKVQLEIENLNKKGEIERAGRLQMKKYDLQAKMVELLKINRDFRV